MTDDQDWTAVWHQTAGTIVDQYDFCGNTVSNCQYSML